MKKAFFSHDVHDIEHVPECKKCGKKKTIIAFTNLIGTTFYCEDCLYGNQEESIEKTSSVQEIATWFVIW